MEIRGALAPLLTTLEKRAVLIALSAAYMLVQLASLPVGLSRPTPARHFGACIDDSAWLVVIYLLMLGAFVMPDAHPVSYFPHTPASARASSSSRRTAAGDSASA